MLLPDRHGRQRPDRLRRVLRDDGWPGARNGAFSEGTGVQDS